MAQEINLKEQKQVLNDNCDFIIDNLDPDDVSDELIQDHLIGEMLHKRSLNQWI